MKKISFFLFLLITLISFFLYLNAKDNIYYAEVSIYKYYEDYYYANKGNVSYDSFVKSLQGKDNRMYYLLKDKKIIFIPDKGFFWGRFNSKRNTIINHSNYTFFNFLFSRKNVFINDTNFKIYDTNYIYRYESNLFIKKEPFNINILTQKYAEHLKCKEFRYIYENDLYQEQALATKIVISQGKTTFFNSEFNKESQNIIKKTLEELYPTKDTLLINLRFINIENIKCLDSLRKKKLSLNMR